jgi:hypothetical protein
MNEGDQGELLSSRQAHEAAYRFVARYYDYERSEAVLRLLDAISSASEHPHAEEGTWASWKQCVQATLDGAPLPELPPPWAS